MKNPLIKRLPRELKEEKGKYLLIFLFLIAAIGFVSGFLVAGSSMKQAYDESFEKYRIEDGHFLTEEPIGGSLIKDLEQYQIDLYENFYLEEEIGKNHMIRIYQMREECNLTSLLEGVSPENGEILIDRLYAENNGIRIGDSIRIGDQTYRISGLAAFSDYSALFKNNTDMMFDANKFTVAEVTKKDFEDLRQTETQIHLCYSWRNREKDLSQEEADKKADEILETLSKKCALTDFVKRSDNQAIMFTGNDMGSDRVMVIWLLYIIICVLAAAFAVTISDTIEKEAAVIGTLRAMGYSKAELLRHYLVLPCLVSLTAAALGNLLGYTLMKQVVAGLYYGSYSLPEYRTIWNGEAFFLTTVIPCLLMLVINLLMLERKLSLTPLQLLRRDLGKRKKRKGVRLRAGSFPVRFRVRILLQNRSAYLTMAVGIFFADFLLLFGLMMSPLLQHYKEDVIGSAIAKYQYILKVPVLKEEEEDYSVSSLAMQMWFSAEISTKEDAERYAVIALENERGEEITVYGIARDSEYLKGMEFPDEKGTVLVSDGYMEKYKIREGDTIRLSEKYEKEGYSFRAAGIWHYPPSLAVFLPIEEFREVFGWREDAFNGYFTDTRIEDIKEEWIASVITEDDLTVVADQLDDSMGQMFLLFSAFAVFIYVLILCLLSKVVIEKNAQSISMIKILGYEEREIKRFYNRSTAAVVALSLLLSLPLTKFVMERIYRFFMFKIRGWLTFYIRPLVFIKILVIGIAVYLPASIWLGRRIRRIPMWEALKNAE